MIATYARPLDWSTLRGLLVLIGLWQGVFALFTMCLPPLFPVLLRTTGAGFCYNFGHITLGGFDTHNNQLTEHTALMETLDGGLTAFYQDLQAHGKADDVLVLTWSEFGRRVQQNANGGTDHGAGSIMFALGNGVQRGLYGDAPNLAALVDNGNVPYTTDFRQVYATVIERWLGVPQEALLGQKWDQLGFLAA